MTKEEAIYKFKKNDVQPLHDQAIENLNSYFEDNLDILKKNFLDNFDEVCNKIVSLQENEGQEEVGYMIYTILRTNIAKRNYSYKVKIYNKYWYVDSNKKDVSNYDVTWAYLELEKIWNKLLIKRKKYIGKLIDADVNIIIQNLLPEYNEYVYRLMKYLSSDLINLQSYNKIEKYKDFMLLIGEYQDNVRAVIL